MVPLKGQMNHLFRAMRIMSLISIAVCIAIWARSFWRSDCFAWTAVSADHRVVNNYRLASSPGHIVFHNYSERAVARDARFPVESEALKFVSEAPRPLNSKGMAPVLRPIGITYSRIGMTLPVVSSQPRWAIEADCSDVMIAVRFPTLLCIVALPWACYFIAVVRSRRRTTKNGIICVVCGYDLRASKDRCPECGKEICIGDVRRKLERWN